MVCGLVSDVAFTHDFHITIPDIANAHRYHAQITAAYAGIGKSGTNI
jgi:hypothetical protein